MERDRSWLIRVSREQASEVTQALARLKEHDRPFDVLRRAERPSWQAAFPLPSLGARLARLQDEIETDRGVAILRGLPDPSSVEDAELLFAGLTSYLGRAISLNTQGGLIQRLFDRGVSYEDLKVRGGDTNAALTPHCDSGDLLALLCLRPAKSGGLSRITSGTTIYNEILAHHPEYLEALFRGFHYNIRGMGPPGRWSDVTRHRVPVFHRLGDQLSIRYNQKAIKTADQVPDGGVSPLTPLETSAVDLVTELAGRPDLSLDFYMEAGDLVVLNNNTVLHTRTAFVDHEEAERKRLLLRSQLVTPNGRVLSDEFADHFNTGPREGPFVRESAR